jgi:hypothetical protein
MTKHFLVYDKLYIYFFFTNYKSIKIISKELRKQKINVKRGLRHNYEKQIRL